MKKILILAIAAVFCFCSCMERVEDYIYTIDLSWETGRNMIAVTDTEGKALAIEFEKAIDTFCSKNRGNWTWVETIYDGRISKADAEAQKLYDKYNAEIKTIMDTYQAKFNAITPDPKSVFDMNYDFILYRSMSGDKTIASTKYNVKYGK